MARRDELPSKKQHETNEVISIIVFFLLIFVSIGDAIRLSVRFIIQLTTSAGRFLWHKITPIYQSVLRSFWSWTHTQTRSLKKPIFTIRIPKIRFPLVSLPSLSLPRLAIPKIHFRRHIPKRQVLFVEKRPSWQTTYRTRSQLAGFLAGVVATIMFFFLPYSGYQWLKNLPNPRLLAHRDLEVTTKIFDRNGVLLYEIYNDQNRTPVLLSQIPAYVKEATIAIEDQSFYEHKGFSVRGILRSLREIIVHRQIQGGSTITQQLIKSALLTPEVTISRKITEIVLAFWAELLYSKDQILELYLNQVPYGGTAWGVEAAAQTYFGKSVTQLSLGEAALLAGLPAAPTEYSPFGNHPEKAFERQTEVLRQMVQSRMITQQQADQALSEKIHFAPPRVGIRAPHFVMYVKELLERQYGPRMVERGGLQIRTSLDIRIQERIEDIVRSHIEALAPLHVGNGAVVVTDPKTGEILAMIGSKDYFNMKDQGNVNVATSLRQPGSSIKVVNYAAALESGFTTATILDDSPVVYRTAGSPAYAPVNYDGTFHGPTPLRYALANSYNIPAVKTLAKIGVASMIQKGRLMGIASWQDEGKYGLSLTLGGGDVTMLEMAKIYGTLANMGNRVDLLPILEVSDYTGRVIERNPPKSPVPAVNPAVAWILTNILSDNIARSRAFGPNSALVIPSKTVAVKTGTSNDKRDNWTIGYTPSYTVTVWVGNNDNSPMDPLLTSGITGAAPIWHDVMIELLKNKPDDVIPKPDSVVAVPCYYDRLEYFVKGTEPPGGRCAPLPTPSPSPSPTP
ncbi:transglycosylase domain-containing protein [Candidatus Gottesmanbacteria bacterium]|nr:transglycosylase domain-containing protein [Candidatus Gottesmanbacteria bacterium]